MGNERRKRKREKERGREREREREREASSNKRTNYNNLHRHLISKPSSLLCQSLGNSNTDLFTLLTFIIMYT